MHRERAAHGAADNIDKGSAVIAAPLPRLYAPL